MPQVCGIVSPPWEEMDANRGVVIFQSFNRDLKHLPEWI